MIEVKPSVGVLQGQQQTEAARGAHPLSRREKLAHGGGLPYFGRN